MRRRPIWFGGQDRSEKSMDEFFTWLGPKKSQQIRLAVMDMWKAFRKSTLKPEHAPQAGYSVQTCQPVQSKAAG
jgi:hypothetical protein